MKNKPCNLGTIRIRWLEVMQLLPKWNIAYSVVAVLPKFKEEYDKAQENLKQIPECYTIVDERPKISIGAKKDLALAGVFDHFYIFGKGGNVERYERKDNEWVAIPDTT